MKAIRAVSMVQENRMQSPIGANTQPKAALAAAHKITRLVFSGRVDLQKLERDEESLLQRRPFLRSLKVESMCSFTGEAVLELLFTLLGSVEPFRVLGNPTQPCVLRDIAMYNLSGWSDGMFATLLRGLATLDLSKVSFVDFGTFITEERSAQLIECFAQRSPGLQRFHFSDNFMDARVHQFERGLKCLFLNGLQELVLRNCSISGVDQMRLWILNLSHKSWLRRLDGIALRDVIPVRRRGPEYLGSKAVGGPTEGPCSNEDLMAGASLLERSEWQYLGTVAPTALRHDELMDCAPANEEMPIPVDLKKGNTIHRPVDHRILFFWNQWQADYFWLYELLDLLTVRRRQLSNYRPVVRVWNGLSRRPDLAGTFCYAELIGRYGSSVCVRYLNNDEFDKLTARHCVVASASHSPCCSYGTKMANPVTATSADSSGATLRFQVSGHSDNVQGNIPKCNGYNHSLCKEGAGQRLGATGKLEAGSNEERAALEQKTQRDAASPEAVDVMDALPGNTVQQTVVLPTLQRPSEPVVRTAHREMGQVFPPARRGRKRLANSPQPDTSGSPHPAAIQGKAFRCSALTRKLLLSDTSVSSVELVSVKQVEPIGCSFSMGIPRSSTELGECDGAQKPMEVKQCFADLGDVAQRHLSSTGDLYSVGTWVEFDLPYSVAVKPAARVKRTGVGFVWGYCFSGSSDSLATNDTLHTNVGVGYTVQWEASLQACSVEPRLGDRSSFCKPALKGYVVVCPFGCRLDMEAFLFSWGGDCAQDRNETFGSLHRRNRPTLLLSEARGLKGNASGMLKVYIPNEYLSRLVYTGPPNSWTVDALRAADTTARKRLKRNSVDMSRTERPYSFLFSAAGSFHSAYVLPDFHGIDIQDWRYLGGNRNVPPPVFSKAFLTAVSQKFKSTSVDTNSFMPEASTGSEEWRCVSRLMLLCGELSPTHPRQLWSSFGQRNSTEHSFESLQRSCSSVLDHPATSCPRALAGVDIPVDSGVALGAGSASQPFRAGLETPRTRSTHGEATETLLAESRDNVLLPPNARVHGSVASTDLRSSVPTYSVQQHESRKRSRTDGSVAPGARSDTFSGTGDHLKTPRSSILSLPDPLSAQHNVQKSPKENSEASKGADPVACEYLSWDEADFRIWGIGVSATKAQELFKPLDGNDCRRIRRLARLPQSQRRGESGPGAVYTHSDPGLGDSDSSSLTNTNDEIRDRSCYDYCHMLQNISDESDGAKMLHTPNCSSLRNDAVRLNRSYFRMDDLSVASALERFRPETRVLESVPFRGEVRAARPVRNDTQPSSASSFNRSTRQRLVSDFVKQSEVESRHEIDQLYSLQIVLRRLLSELSERSGPLCYATRQTATASGDGFSLSVGSADKCMSEEDTAEGSGTEQLLSMILSLASLAGIRAGVQGAEPTRSNAYSVKSDDLHQFVADCQCLWLQHKCRHIDFAIKQSNTSHSFRRECLIQRASRLYSVCPQVDADSLNSKVGRHSSHLMMFSKDVRPIPSGFSKALQHYTMSAVPPLPLSEPVMEASSRSSASGSASGTNRCSVPGLPDAGPQQGRVTYKRSRPLSLEPLMEHEATSVDSTQQEWSPPSRYRALGDTVKCRKISTADPLNLRALSCADGSKVDPHCLVRRLAALQHLSHADLDVQRSCSLLVKRRFLGDARYRRRVLAKESQAAPDQVPAHDAGGPQIDESCSPSKKTAGVQKSPNRSGRKRSFALPARIAVVTSPENQWSVSPDPPVPASDAVSSPATHPVSRNTEGKQASRVQKRSRGAAQRPFRVSLRTCRRSLDEAEEDRSFGDKQAAEDALGCQSPDMPKPESIESTSLLRRRVEDAGPTKSECAEAPGIFAARARPSEGDCSASSRVPEASTKCTSDAVQVVPKQALLTLLRRLTTAPCEDQDAPSVKDGDLMGRLRGILMTVMEHSTQSPVEEQQSASNQTNTAPLKPLRRSCRCSSPNERVAVPR